MNYITPDACICIFRKYKVQASGIFRFKQTQSQQTTE